MGKRATMLVTCSTCGKKIKCTGEGAERVLAGTAKCPGCGMILKPDKSATGWAADDAVAGEQLETRQNALLTVKNSQGVAVVSFAVASVRDAQDTRRLEEELGALVDDQGFTHVAVNFASLRFMSSSVISVLVRFRAKIKAAGGDIAICNLSPDILQALKITRVGELLNIRKSEEHAVTFLAKQM